MTSILPLRQHLTSKKVGQDLTLLRKEWRKFKAMLDSQEYERMNRNGRHAGKMDKDSPAKHDGLSTLTLLVNQPFVSKLAELKDILLVLQTQITAQFAK